jgi:predicted Rossmann fold nucleotide-binding protein DprA/Smf involved in DNA uptake
MVGSRRSTGVGRRTAERIALELSGVEVTVVSGLALGIDGAAHRGALSGPGGTISVLGWAPDRVYLAGNRGLFLEVLRWEEKRALSGERVTGCPVRWLSMKLVAQSGLPVERVMAALARLEWSRLVGRSGDGWSLSLTHR